MGQGQKETDGKYVWGRPLAGLGLSGPDTGRVQFSSVS